ncbi:hypothetical protein D9M71_824900 [compost metagenome]
MLIAVPSANTHSADSTEFSQERCRATFSQPAWTTRYQPAEIRPVAIPSVVESSPGRRTNTMLVDSATANGAVR